MLKIVLLTLLSFNIFALEISLQGAKENHQSYSTFHIKDSEKFLCQEIIDDFEAVSKIVCAFSKSPSQKIQRLQNSFFEIDTETKKGTFFLVIKPFHKMKLFPMVFDLKKEDTTFSADVKLSSHWMIVGYMDEMPLLQKHEYSEAAINFPFTYAEDMLPYVGSLDMKGNPVHIKKVGDVTEYLKIKKFYEEKNYEFTLELIDDIMREYPNSLFRAELLFYKIRVFSKLQENENVVEAAKEFLREYSSDENVAEVLSLIARAYSKLGISSDADYFFDRLFSEHADSPYSYWGYIYLAESLELSGSSTRARTLYEKVLSQSDDIDVAAEAAFRLAQNHIANSNAKEAAAQIEKIIKAKPEYFAEINIYKSMDMMYDLADNAELIQAAGIAKALFENIEPTEDVYEELSRNIGIWLSKTDKKQEALTALNKYLERFGGGMYAEEVQIAKDSLFFDVSDENASVKLDTYDKLMDEYQNDSIGNKAIYEKAKLLIAEGMFAESLAMERDLLNLNQQEYPDVQEIITQAAIGTMKQALKVKECNSVLLISSQYKIELSDEWDDGVYECAMKGADFELAKKMADKNLNSKDLEHRKKWLYRYIKVDFATGNYSNVIEASKELVALIKDDKESPYKDVYRTVFDTYHRLENQQKMIESIVALTKVYKDDYIDIERYVAVMAVGAQIKDNNLVIEYGEKIMAIQQSSDSYAQSPFVEFALYQACIDKEEYNRALEVIRSLDTLELDATQRARQKYLLGSVLEKLWRDDESQKAYQEAIDAAPESAWAELAKSAKAIQ
ncbi:flagellar protein [Sulfurimonas crateris]|uniref:Flagellar protein n=1 Tax=Sulfurimonas crateris TaxID=2574727 RepID=A0A4V5TLM8_9BACT|nr:flagellar protein [Sulfurimonas crateris]TKI68403.1 flagellar protein [Sulfurimonas crateris]